MEDTNPKLTSVMPNPAFIRHARDVEDGIDEVVQYEIKNVAADTINKQFAEAEALAFTPVPAPTPLADAGIQAVTSYRTDDGLLFESKTEAIQHRLEQLVGPNTSAGSVAKWLVSSPDSKHVLALLAELVA